MAVPTITFGPVALDLKLYAGDGFAVQFVFVDKVTGLPWPATGTWEAQIRAPATNAVILTSFTIDDSLEATGEITASLTGEQVRSLLGVSNAYWDLQQIIPGSEPRTWYRGRITASQDVTRA